MKKIVQIGDKVLRSVAQEVPISEITSSKIQNIISDMKKALDAEPDGAALAAPQIGVTLRIFVLAQKVFGPEGAHKASSKDTHLVFINPSIIKKSAKKALVDEGCLSVRGRYGTIERSKNATIVAYDEFGNKFTRGAGGLLAQAFQHECDHLDGTLFIDGAKELWEVEIPESK
jgi:peptide deformylase